MKVVFFGTPDFGARMLKALFDAGHELIAAVSQPDKAVGRHQKETVPTPVHDMANLLGIPLLSPERIDTPEFKAAIACLSPDCIVVAAYGRILPPEILSIPPFGCINVHASLLPRWRGAAPVQWAIMKGDSLTGVTIMQMDRGLDTGDILLRESTPIGEGENAGELQLRLSDIGASLLVRALGQLEEGRLTPVPQDDSLSTYAPMLTKDMGNIDWKLPSEKISLLIRGLSPWPGAYSFSQGRMIKILCARALHEQYGLNPGEVSTEGARLIVCSGSGSLEILSLQPEGKNKMSAADYLRGHRILGFSDKRS